MKKALSIFFSAVVVIALLFPSTYFKAEENNEAKEGSNISEENIKEDDVQVNDKKDVGNINVEVNDNEEKQVKDDEGTNGEEKNEEEGDKKQEEESGEKPESKSEPIISASDKTIKVGDKFNPLDGVSAKSGYGEDLTNKIEISDNEVNVDKAGTYKVSYYVKDSNGKEASKTITVTVEKDEEKENSLPIINASDKTIELGSKFNPLDGVSASDEEDGDLTNNITIISSNVDVNKEGVYVVTYEVKDNDGGKARKSINITVVKKTEKENKAPIIKASDKTIKKGQKFNPLDGVSASDEEDGDLTSKIKVVENKVDVNSIGKYSVSFEVTDSGGKSITKSINVTVEAKSESKSNKSPIIYAEDITVALGSKYDPYAMVSASDPEDGNITNKIKVVYNYVNVNKEGTYKVGYKVTDSSGNSASCVIKVKVKDMNTQKKKEKTNNVPVIYCNDIFIALNSKFNPLEWVAVTDKEDGDITNKVMAIYNNVNTSIEGNYHVTYEVVDSDGNKVNKAMMVVVESEDELNKENTPPIINANNITVKKGTYFNPLDGVTALDREDGNLTNNIIIKENSVNINKSGVYQITYEVTDKKGLSTTKTINVTVEGTGIFNSLVIVEISIVVLLIIGISSITVAIISNRKKK